MEPERRRRRPAVSCVLCRRRKIRCNRETPCSNCTKSKNATCVYRDPPRAPRPPPHSGRRQGAFGDTSQPTNARLAPGLAPGPASAPAPDLAGAAPLTPCSGIPSSSSNTANHHRPSRPASAAPANSIAESSLDSRSPGHYVPPGRIRAAPEHAASSAPSPANTPVSTFTKNSRVETKTLNFSGGFYFHTEHKLACQPQAITRSVSHKTRMFGQSHWVNSIGLLSDMFDVIERYLRDDGSRVFQIEKRCKVLARIIKSRRAPSWPCVPTPELPARVVADSLVECYFNSSETLLRVLHIPSFRRAYEAVWDPDHTPDPAFLVQLKLVLAMGATTYDANFTLRPSAVQWVYEAQTWLSTPEFKHRLSLTALQANLLLLIAREETGVGEDLCWVAVGSILRIAIYMGLHRDPAGLGPGHTTPLVAEMRRRLWNTVLEVSLQSSLNSGGPPMISLDQFDTEPPGNFDDDQLTGAEGDMPLPKPDGHFSQTTTAIALRNMLPQRLAIAKYLNDLSSRSSYAETLKLDTDLREAYKTLIRTLQACKTPTPHCQRGPSELELRGVEILLRRYFIALHLPFFGTGLKQAEFAFSRRVVVESAVRLWRAAFPTPLSSLPDSDAASSSSSDRLSRVAISGTGNFRTLAVQGFIAIAVELNVLLDEEEGRGLGSGPAEVRPDLLMALADYQLWSWKAIENGETNTKGYLMACLISAQVEAARRGLEEGEAVAYVIKVAEEAEERALALLEEVERKGRLPQGEGVVGAGGDGVGEPLLATTPDLGVEDWDYLMSDTLFDSVGADISWVFQ